MDELNKKGNVVESSGSTQHRKMFNFESPSTTGVPLTQVFYLEKKEGGLSFGMCAHLEDKVQENFAKDYFPGLFKEMFDHNKYSLVMSTNNRGRGGKDMFVNIVETANGHGYYETFEDYEVYFADADAGITVEDMAKDASECLDGVGDEA